MALTDLLEALGCQTESTRVEVADRGVGRAGLGYSWVLTG